ncbi:hypothetical protein [Streptomyces griseomycini]|uniref:Uncharacterized protein n=1 Tax=Streptomyces griseomycini TaxID=66895 RepID=A0A7W7LXF2_9ACTN|nr:hypothetical protein [Streptomyces griseomycini]MBB4898208.1 hypothetical protein [Streptomyces griseomycini]GGQ39794.1 hypothetical protein GCM10010266_73660 [Streptomyces griseomycini]GGR53261.1 hypothetical protein GCM10015536_68310 [Streptomyces griseomycini]
MANPVELGARAAAQRLTTPHSPHLASDVEAALHARQSTTRPEQYLDPISLGALIVSVASLAWTVYSDLKKQTSAPHRDVITRHVRIRLDQSEAPPQALSSADRDRYIDITIEETLNAAQDSASGQG